MLQEGNIIPEDERMAIMGLIASPFIVATQCLNLFNCWERLKLSCLIYRRRNSEISREMIYGEIKAYV